MAGLQVTIVAKVVDINKDPNAPGKSLRTTFMVRDPTGEITAQIWHNVPSDLEQLHTACS